MKHVIFSLLLIQLCQCLLHDLRLGDATAIWGGSTINTGEESTSLFRGVTALSMHMNTSSGRTKKGDVRKKKNPTGSNKFRPQKSDANAMALKLGLKLVPASTSSTKSMSDVSKVQSSEDRSEKIGNNTQDKQIIQGGGNIKKKKKKKRAKKRSSLPPPISWGMNAKNFFWGKSDADNSHHEQQHQLKNAQNLQYTSSEGGRQLKVELISNDQGFPLYQIHNVLPRQSLNRAISLLIDNDIKSYAEELEQHELVKGKPHALRRSLVSQLRYSCDDNYSHELMDLILAGLPINLVKGMHEDTDKDKSSVNHPHPYEDGSVVYYRATGNDFYNTHHDSYDPEEPPRRHQRAYTILLYLRAPDGSLKVGGTEFPRLTKRGRLYSKESDAGNADSNEVIVVKPRAGDAICWPNFDLAGKPYMDSIHKALPIPKERKGQVGSNQGSGEIYSTGHHKTDLSKIVVNLWFEGYAKNRH